MKAQAGRLTDEDRILWGRVAQSTVPLGGRALASEAVEPEPADAAPQRSQEAPPARPAHHAQRPAVPAPLGIDRPTRQKLGKGRLALDARVDLHGMTQASAHHLLHSFLHRAHAEGLRHVLVITGKGASLGSEGALRRAVPQWLATPAFRPLVSGFDAAMRGHGGEGALYVRLRRK